MSNTSFVCRGKCVFNTFPLGEDLGLVCCVFFFLFGFFLTPNIRKTQRKPNPFKSFMILIKIFIKEGEDPQIIRLVTRE